MKKIKLIRGGAAYVWWLTYKHEVRAAVLFLVLAVLFLGYYELRLFAARGEKDELVKLLSDERAARALPSTVFILEGSTIEQAQIKLARIAGDLDLARYEMGKKK